jgi:hypothetical protein
LLDGGIIRIRICTSDKRIWLWEAQKLADPDPEHLFFKRCRIITWIFLKSYLRLEAEVKNI